LDTFEATVTGFKQLASRVWNKKSVGRENPIKYSSFQSCSEFRMSSKYFTISEISVRTNYCNNSNSQFLTSRSFSAFQSSQRSQT